MMKHEIDLDGLIEWRKEKEVLFASSTNPRKRLFCTLGGKYNVYHDGKLMLSTSVPGNAVKEYNSIN